MSFIREVITWYQINKRDLPWRNTNNPYIIWLSEIILQQTRVDQGTPYFYRFGEKYPTVAHFAAASEDEILNLWQGLGYYSRGRNMHRTAQMVMQQYAGNFPSSYEDLLKLKGIGEYTAAAISSFCAGEAKAVVDGNVFRVLARYFGVDEPINSARAKKLFTEIANDVIDKSQPGISNQAMMEFGSLQCRPKNPLCESCPVKPSCIAFKNNLVNKLPVKLKKAPSKNRYFNYIVLLLDGQILINKRGPNDIWQNLHELPLIESDVFVDADTLIIRDDFSEIFGKVQITRVVGPIKHVLSHQNIYAQFIVINGNVNRSAFAEKGWFFIPLENLEHLAQPKLIFAFLKKFLS